MESIIEHCNTVDESWGKANSVSQEEIEYQKNINRARFEGNMEGYNAFMEGKKWVREL